MKVCNYGGNSMSGSCVIDLLESPGSVEPPSLTTSSMLCPQGASFRAFVLTPTPCLRKRHPERKEGSFQRN